MNWQQAAEALNALSSISVKIRKAGDWYVEQQTERGGDGFLVGVYGNGETPEAAIADHWEKLTAIQYPLYIVSHKRGNRIHSVWNGFMWVQLNEEDAE